MASLTIGGQLYELRVSADGLRLAEQQLMKAGGRPILAAFLGKDAGVLSMTEMEAIVAAAWRDERIPDAEIRNRIAQFYRDGGTVFDLHQAASEALLESGAIRARANGAGPDPPRAGSPH